MQTLSIDIETYSELDIKKVGGYKYAENSEIILFGYAFGDEPVRVVDMAGGETLPAEARRAIFDGSVLKAAYNAPFERAVLNSYFSAEGGPPARLGPEGWFCTMVQAYTLGLPGGLDNVSKVLRLSEDKAKLAAGKQLIQYFCKPCKPTKANGERTRNLPAHAPEKWALFKEYCRRDVEAERTIRKMMQKFTPNNFERRLWFLDQKINDRGVRIDQTLVKNAIAADTKFKAESMREARDLSGIENPNSREQVLDWFEEQEGYRPEKFDKEAREGLLAKVRSPVARRLLELKQLLSKTSVKKYEAMRAAVCDDGRVHGALQFYGAARTGRWCLTGDHEILTRNGWERLDEWHGGVIACWTPSTEAMSFQKAEALEFRYQGEVYAVESQRCSQLSTPDHRMPYWGKNGGWQSDTIKKLGAKRFIIPFTGKRLVSGGLEHTSLRILIMTQADGHFTEDGTLRFHFSKSRKIERCKSLLRKAGIPFLFSVHEKTVTISVKSRYMPIWLRMFQDKTFKPWLLDESADVFFDELELWDSYRHGPNSIQYTTTNKQNADIVQALAHLSGRAATIVTKATIVEKWSEAYVVNIWLTPGNRNEIRQKAITQSYSGKVYCAETKTGFFLVRRNGKAWITGNSGRQVQLHNLPKNKMTDLDFARRTLAAGDYELLAMFYDNLPDVLSQLIRTAFIAEEGGRFIVADFSAIEARVIAWLAGEKWRLDVFAGDGKIYEASAAQMFRVPVETIDKHSPLRQKGKVAELACGYQGGPGALIQMGALRGGLTEDELPGIIQRWRKASPKIVKMWWDVEKYAMEAVKNKTRVNYRHGVQFIYESGMLFVRLPSGRRLAYVRPRLKPEPKFNKIGLTYEGAGQEAGRKGAGGWIRHRTYGGKLVENCLSEATKVLTDRGWVQISKLKKSDRLWDGLEWVSHQGIISKGARQTISLDGVRMTPDHMILTKEEGWKCASSCEGYHRAEIKRPYSNRLRRIRRKEVPLESKMRLRKRVYNARHRVQQGNTKILWLSEKAENCRAKPGARYVQSSGLWDMAGHDRTLQTVVTSSLKKLWWARHSRMRKMGKKFYRVLGRYGTELQARFDFGASRRERRLYPNQLSMGESKRPSEKQEEQYAYADTLGQDYSSGNRRKIGHRRNNAALSTRAWLAAGRFFLTAGFYEPVWDVVNAGPRNRFVVKGRSGPLIVHNCVQAIARDCLAVAMMRLDEAGYRIVMHVHDEVILEMPDGQGSVEEACEIMGRPIDWAKGLPLSAEGYETKYYKKD